MSIVITQEQMGFGRVGIKKWFAMEAETVEQVWKDIIGRTDLTKQTFEVYKQFMGLGPAQQTDEGKGAIADTIAPLFLSLVKPVMFTKMVTFTAQTEFTDQYAKMKGLQPAFKRSFTERRNINAANLDNFGFTTQPTGAMYGGMNNEALYSITHAMKDVIGYNRPINNQNFVPGTSTVLDIAFGPLALEQGYSDLRKQKGARNLPMAPTGKIDVKVPPDLYPAAARVIRSMSFPTAPNAGVPNAIIRDKFNSPVEVLYYTSPTAWFLKAANPAEHGLFFMEQMPYDIFMPPLTQDLMHRWVAFESWILGWFDWHGTWGTQGA